MSEIKSSHNSTTQSTINSFVPNNTHTQAKAQPTIDQSTSKLHLIAVKIEEDTKKLINTTEQSLTTQEIIQSLP